MAGAPRSAPPAPARVRWWGLAALLLLCAAPHVVRMALPSTVLADGFYGHAALMLARGYTPYLHFTQVAFPLAETVVAFAMRCFGTDLRVVETCNLLVILGVAAALRVAARRLALLRGSSAGDVGAAGIIAALAWSWCAWVIHFNLFEHETWAALGTALAFVALFGGDRRDAPGGLTWSRVAAIAGALALACCLKLTALMAAGGVIAWLLVRRGPPRATVRVRDAGRVALLLLALLGAATLLGLAAWGTPFLEQVFLFGFFRNPNVMGPLDALTLLLSWTDPLLLLGYAALLVHGLPRLREPVGAAALVLLADLAFLTFPSPTLWNHNLISLAPAAALLLAGALTARPRPTRALAVATAALTVLVLLLPARGAPAGDPPAEPTPESPSGAATAAPWAAARAPFGPLLAAFGGWPRDGVARRAAFLRRWSRPDDIVATLHPWWSVQADRIEAIRYYDLQAIARGVEATVRADGLRAAWAQREGPLLIAPADVTASAPAGPAAGAGASGAPAAGSAADPRFAKLGPYYGRLLACGVAYERPLLLAGLARREIALVMEPLPTGLLGEDDLRAARYARFEDHELGIAGWRPQDGPGAPVVREIFGR